MQYVSSINSWIDEVLGIKYVIHFINMDKPNNNDKRENFKYFEKIGRKIDIVNKYLEKIMLVCTIQ